MHWMIVAVALFYWYFFNYVCVAIWWVASELWIWNKKRQGELAAVEATRREYHDWLIQQAEQGHNEYLNGGDGLPREQFQPRSRLTDDNR